MKDFTDNDATLAIQSLQEIDAITGLYDSSIERDYEPTSFRSVDQDALAEVPQAFAAFCNHQLSLWGLS